eukprot:TRINITY_DN14995_c0_g1_i1.p1 TRINITY_DN14995_c0_g1~~TRINITY_DN14995_c0_g1_i1.p1  ORF type:complete len:147 (-),score=16.32 TRINITY_DN14995_c0_g1_i1:258-698(-)
MTSDTTWESLKAEGNSLFAAQEWLKAAAKYSSAIKIFAGDNDQLAILYSNRCAALTRLSKLSKALADADKCLELRPAWEKGCFRKGAALELMKDFVAALDTYQKGLEVSPENAELAQKVQRLTPYVNRLSRPQKEQANTEIDQESA